MVDEPVRGVVPERGLFSLTGLEQLRAYTQRRLPSTPHARLLGYRLTQASAGSAVINHPISPWFEIYDGFVDLQATAGVSVFCTAATAAPPAVVLRPVTMSMRYLRPCTIDDEAVIARGRLLHAGSTFTTVETLMEDSLGRAVAHATGCVVAVPMDPPPAPFDQPLCEDAEDAAYATPDPPRRPRPALDAALPPAAHFLGMEVVELAPDRAVATLPASTWFCNTHHEVDSGIVASFGNLTASLLLPGRLDRGERAVTFEATSTYLAPIRPDGRPVVATARLHAAADDVFVLDVEAADADGRRVLVGRGTLLRRSRRQGQGGAGRRALLTVLFTDVVDSTRHASDLGDARWRETLDQHDLVVRRQLALHGGREVKTTGDGFLATFESPSQAVRCAVAARAGIERLGLAMRAGLHTGECTVTGTDVSGIAVHVASRIEAVAGPGEILVSATVADLLAGSGIDVDDRGLHALKGVDGPRRLHAVLG